LADETFAERSAVNLLREAANKVIQFSESIRETVRKLYAGLLIILEYMGKA